MESGVDAGGCCRLVCGDVNATLHGPLSKAFSTNQPLFLLIQHSQQKLRISGRGEFRSTGEDFPGWARGRFIQVLENGAHQPLPSLPAAHWPSCLWAPILAKAELSSPRQPLEAAQSSVLPAALYLMALLTPEASLFFSAFHLSSTVL